MIRLLKSSLLFFSVCILSFCTKPLRYGPGLMLIEKQEVAQSAAPVTLRALFKVTTYSEREKSSFTSVFSTQTEQRVKMDFKGPLGSHLASFYWVRDSGWVLVIPKEKLGYQGQNNEILLPFLGLDSVTITEIFGFLWGRSIQQGKYHPLEPVNKNHIYIHATDSTQYGINSTTGLVAWKKLRRYRVTYGDYDYVYNRPIARKVRVFSGDEPLVDIKVKKVEDNPLWKKSPFFIKIPKGLELEAIPNRI